jgi:Na+-transporting NADH:ubiquinone oxidoreductase subunit NqrB
VRLVLCPCLLAILWKASRNLYSRGFFLILLGAAILGALFDVFIWTNLTGRPGLFIDLLRTTQSTVGFNPHVLESQSGPPDRLFGALWVLLPCPVTLALLGVAVAILPYGWMPAQPVQKLGSVAAGMAAWALLFAFFPHWQNVRFLSPIYSPVCLFRGFGIVSILSATRKIFPPTGHAGLSCVSLLLLTALLGRDWLRFDKSVRAGITDELRTSDAVAQTRYSMAPALRISRSSTEPKFSIK